ncbi:alpha/beta fold hydrolase [Arthrobacter oryzae]|uniref:Pimeloyl-ACP methyl ester carboxylesterase n=1 Tax=Arthrobacter oryzae TaxID=409290 RepID=A0A495FL86_9MICC|nr:alpha/beta fold hydrolase [Arthrobacter oryzae]RKR29998.1 pimeloyl-ACP methyl ester carboxylesterase [Arthrobacter oryzae]
MAGAARRDRAVQSGVFRNGMEYVTWGRGAKSLLFIQGGPGSVVPHGLLGGLFRREFDPYLDAGYAVWIVTRRRNMLASHTSADMAEDYAHVIAEQFGGRVDLVLAKSFGGMIGQHLAARHPESFRRIALVATAAELSAWGKDVDHRMAAAIAAGDPGGAGSVLAEYVLPGPRTRWLRDLLGPVVGRRVLSRPGCPATDVLTEARAGQAFDARAELPLIRPPVLLLCGGRDSFFPRTVAEETARQIPDCTLVVYERLGHLRAASSRRVPRDVLAFARAR